MDLISSMRVRAAKFNVDEVTPQDLPEQAEPSL
jgi:hypothetical protein